MSVLMKSTRTRVLGNTAAGSTTLTSAIVDMQGYESITFAVFLGALTTGQTLGVLQVNGGNQAGGGDMAALAGATITVADADASKVDYIEVVRPTNVRYVEIVFTRNSQAAAVYAIEAVQYGLHKPPDNYSDTANTIAQQLVAVDPEVSTSGVDTTSATYGNSNITVVTTARTSS